MKKQTKKKIINAGITVVLLSSLIAAVALATGINETSSVKTSIEKSKENPVTGDYDTQALGVGSFSPSSSHVEVGDTFTVTFYADSGVDTMDGITIRQLLFNTTDGRVLANIITHDAGTPGISYNVTFTPTWAAALVQDGALDNTTGNLTYVMTSLFPSTETGNNSAILINFTALHAGILNIRIPYTIWSGQPGLALSGIAPDIWTNTSVTIHPANPTGFTATTWNHTAINLSWNTPTNPLDNTTVCGKSGSYPSGPSDSVLYNGTNLTYNHTGLNNCTTYYYRAWSYNASTGMHSLLNDSQTAMTSCYTNFTLTGVNPTNGSTTVNCTYNIPVNVTVINSYGKVFNYYINCTDGTQEGGTAAAANQSISVTMNGLNHNTQYWWNVTVWESANPIDCVTVGYTFTTGQGGGTAPSATIPYPTSGNTSLPVNVVNLSVIVTDPDGDDVNTTFRWSNGTVIGYVNFTGSGSRIWCNKTVSLNYNTTYSWYVVTRDACSSRTGSTYTFTTDKVIILPTKTMTVLANNTIRIWINLTNNGQANVQNLVVNDTYDSDITYVGSSPANDSGDIGEWTVPWINITGATKWYNITIWVNLSGPLANGSTVTNSGTLTGTGGYSNTFTATPLTMCYWATKEANMTSLHANTTQVNFTINITNCGDFYLNWVQVNETYPANYTYNNSNVTGNGTSETFNITQIAPGATASMWIVLNTTYGDGGGILVNGSRIWNNITIDSNETLYPYYRNTSLYVGARTTMLRITYTTIYYDMVGLTNTVFGIVGIILIISTILLIVGMMYVYRGGGFGGNLGGEGEWRG